MQIFGDDLNHHYSRKTIIKTSFCDQMRSRSTCIVLTSPEKPQHFDSYMYRPRGRIQRFSLRGRNPWRARGARAYNGGLGAEPPAGSRGRVPGGGSGAEVPLKLKAFWLLNVPQSRKTSFLFLFAKCSFRNSKGFTPSEGVK